MSIFPITCISILPHDQRYELKLAIMLNFDPVYFSASYIYGSGFAIPEGGNININREVMPGVSVLQV